MKKYLVLYKCPTAVLDGWMKTPEAERKEMETKMQKEWQEWGMKNAAAIIETAGAGKTTLVDSSGAKDGRNEIMLYSLVQADSREAAAQIFVGHPHLGIPQATIEVMDANVLPGMQK